MKVTFVLPGAAPFPTGGVRMVLRYANALVAAGWSVNIVMPSVLKRDAAWRYLLRVGRFWLWRLSGGYSPHRWFKVAPGVELHWVRDLLEWPEADVVIATSVQTAEAVASWPELAGRKFYLVQGYETWDFPADRVHASWRLPFEKIAVSRWLCGLIESAGASALHLPNGVDPQTFGVDRSWRARRAQTLLWPHHPSPQKGSADVVAALRALRVDFPQLQAVAYGTAAPPQWRDVALSYHRDPPQARLRQLYNEARVFVAPSHAEGWGLPACEALQSGCAVAASNIGGHREFLRDHCNALLHEPGNVDQLVFNLRRLLHDEALGETLAMQGVADVAVLRFDASVERLQRLLRKREAP